MVSYLKSKWKFKYKRKKKILGYDKCTVEISQNFCGLLRIHELYKKLSHCVMQCSVTYFSILNSVSSKSLSTLKIFESPYIRWNGGNDKGGTKLKVPYEIILPSADTFFEIGTTPNNLQDCSNTRDAGWVLFGWGWHCPTLKKNISSKEQ